MTAKKTKPKSSIKFTSDAAAEQKPNTVDQMTQALRSQPQHQSLNKTVRPQTVKRDLKGKYDTTKVVFSSNNFSQQIDGVETKGWRRLSDFEQRELSQRDPYISAIIANRCAQGAVIGYPSDSKFDKGCRILDLEPPDRDKYENTEEYHRDVQIHEAEQKAILKWITNCGSSDEPTLNAMFAGADLTFKHCTLREFLEAQIRNLLTFGRAGTQILRNEDGIPVAFRPVPIETIFNQLTDSNMWIANGDQTMPQSQEDAQEWNEIDIEERPAAYVQKVDGVNINAFSEDDLHVWHWQKQALFDLNGYPLSPIEQAIYMVWVHQQTLTYLSNQFVKGLANKGMITMEATQPGVEISEADMENFRQQFHNFATRNDNSSTVPVVGGPIKVNYIPLSSTPRDMEFLQIEEHVIRALCSAFQISPQEMGYGHLSQPQGLGGQSNKQEDIIKGEERGLRMLLDIVFDGVNKILYLNFPDAEGKYRVSYVGVGEDTRDAVIQRQQMELNTTATMTSLFADSEKHDAVPFGGDMLLSNQFNANVVRFMLYSEVRHHFFKDKEAMKNPAYDFICDPGFNQSYQGLKVSPIEMQQAQAQMGAEGQKMELEANEMQMQQGQQGQQGAEGQDPSQQEATPEDAAAAEEQEQGGKEPVEKSLSLRDKWLQAQKLQKSTNSYMSAWVRAHSN